MIKNEKIRSLLNIAIALGFVVSIPLLFYWLVDWRVYEHILATVPGPGATRQQAYTAWYLSYDWVLLAVEFLINISVTFLLLRYMLKFHLKDIKAWFSGNLRQFVTGLLLGTIAISTVFAVLVFTGNARVLSWQPDISASLLNYLLVFVLVGFSEELFYRGFVITNLNTFKNTPFIILCSSVIFSVIHTQNNAFNFIAFLNIALIGGVFAYMFIRTNSLWMPIGFHIVWNYLQGSIYGFHVSGLTVPSVFTTEYDSYNILNGGDFGPEGGLVTTFVTLLVLVFIGRYFRKKTAFAASGPAKNIPA